MGTTAVLEALALVGSAAWMVSLWCRRRKTKMTTDEELEASLRSVRCFVFVLTCTHKLIHPFGVGARQVGANQDSDQSLEKGNTSKRL